MKLQYCGFFVRVVEHSFGTSGTLFRIIALTARGRDRKHGPEWRFHYDPSANAGRGLVVENTLLANEHVIYVDPDSCDRYDQCPCACDRVRGELMTP